jgi:hypothetical protein
MFFAFLKSLSRKVGERQKYLVYPVILSKDLCCY